MAPAGGGKKFAVGALFCETPLLAAAQSVIDRFLARAAATALRSC